MRISRITSLVIAVVALLLVLTSIAEAARSREELQQLYSGYLALNGYSPSVDSDGDITFKYEGKTLFIEVNESDEAYFRVGLPNIWTVDSDAERLQVLTACNNVTASTKVVKAYVTSGNNVWISMELFLPEQGDFGKVLQRGLVAMNAALDGFLENMSGD